MPLSAPAPFSSSFPALYLYPLNDSFVPKHISLLHNQRVKIGRQTNAKTAPGERNGFFDSKVLSRQHAEVWEEDNKIFIKDVKSSNGTFINGERLSPEGLESEPFVLKSDDIVEFGIDIVGEDNKTIIHHKVAARVLCILTDHDAQMAARTEQLQVQQMHQQYSPGSNMQPQGPPSMMNQAGPSNGGPGAGPSNSGFGFPNQQQRRPMSHQNGISGMGGMGGSMRPPGKSGLTFDHILTRLQGELQKSRETSTELHSVTGAMNEIHETLGGGLPPNVPPFSQPLPPVHPPQQQSSSPQAEGQRSEHLSASSSSNSVFLSELQSQLSDTQSSLALHVEKIRALESALKEQETIRHEVRLLHEMMDAIRGRDFSNPNANHSISDEHARGPFDLIDEDGSDDDAMSVGTAVPHELERVEEEDEEQMLAASSDMEPISNDVAESREQSEHEEEDDQPQTESYDREEDEEERQRRRQELGRPHTPEPTNLGMRDSGDLYESRKRSKTLVASRSPIANGNTHSIVDDLTSRMDTLSAQLVSALELSSNLQAQHTTAQSTIQSLEGKVASLEKLVTVKLSQQQNGSASPISIPAAEQPASSSQFDSLTEMVSEWKKSVEGQWSGVREEWSQERERISRAREEWEAKARNMDTGLEKLERLQHSVHSNYQFNGNGDVVQDHGLATPPSPRSLSADSQKPRRRRSSGRGRSSSKRRGSTSEGPEVGSDRPDDLSSSAKINRDTRTINHLATPAPTLDGSSSSIVSSPTNDSTPHSKSGPLNPRLVSNAFSSNDVPSPYLQEQHQPHMQTAVGVLMLSIAAAAVIWRVKPE